jgi:hypothetical protein
MSIGKISFLRYRIPFITVKTAGKDVANPGDLKPFVAGVECD